MKAMSETEERNAIVDVVRRLEAKGLNHGTSGNVSVRSDGGALITPSGANGANLTAERIVRLYGDHAIGGGKPSSEWQMHAAILDAFPHVAAVIHTHADACVALSCLRHPLPAFHYMVAAFGGDDVRCASYATFGSADLASSAIEALDGRTACLLANHGMIAVGATLEAAYNATIKLETLARQYLLALQGGEPVLLPPDEMAKVRELYKTYGVIQPAMPVS